MTTNATTRQDQEKLDTGPSIHRLILMRHAKSDWTAQSRSDHDRPLNHRGREAAPAMATWLMSENLVPDRVLSSSSRRTRETIERMIPCWNEESWNDDDESRVIFTDDLYLATPSTIVETINTQATDGLTVLVLAHNPGITSAASQFAQKAIEMPTAAVAVFEVPFDSWDQLRLSDQLEMTHWMRPKAL